ncbi:MAG: GNAT family N-acetyltransferase [Nocardioides sp.]|uniref:GNAT family N-acetyltransferase n=1 Tax=Nocardioides sp. TaxID=35761 RepID=UPI003D6B43D8
MLRPATDADLPLMLAWRNQDANRSASIHQHVINADEHAAWWSRVQQDPTRRVLMFEYSGQPLGVVTFFDHSAETRTVSWGFYLDHDGTTAAGTALLAWTKIMREAVAYAFSPEPDGLGVDVLEGEVLPHNESVRTMNRRLGFTEGDPVDQEVGDSVVTAIPVRLRREDSRTTRTQASTAGPHKEQS